MLARGLGVFLVSSVLVVACTGTDGLPASSSAPLEQEQPLLAPPAKGEGFQLLTEAVVTPPGTEEQDCYFYKVADLAAANGMDPTKAVNLHRIQIVQRDGSHHMNIFRVRTIAGLDPANGAVQKATNGKGECFNSANWADWPLVANTQEAGELDWTFPDGVANVLQPDEWLMLQTHYVNASTQQTPDGFGQVAANFHSIPAEQVRWEMGTLFATQQSIRVCESNPTPTYYQGCQFNSKDPVHVIAANGHFHSRGKQFDIYAWDGQSTTVPPDSAKMYESDAWAEPPMKHSPELDVTIQPGGGVFYSCSYQWQPPSPAIGCDGLNQLDATKHMTPADQLDCCYTFGGIVDKNEHCNAFVYYWPKVDDVFCN